MSLCLIPLLSIVVTTPLIRLLCDYLVFEIVDIPIQDSLFEYSLSRILVSVATDLLSIIWMPSILTLVHSGMSIETVDHIAQTMRTTASVPIQTHAGAVSVSVCGSNVYSQEYQSMLSLLTSARAHVYTSASSYA